MKVECFSPRLFPVPCPLPRLEDQEFRKKLGVDFTAFLNTKEHGECLLYKYLLMNSIRVSYCGIGVFIIVDIAFFYTSKNKC